MDVTVIWYRTLLSNTIDTLNVEKGWETEIIVNILCTRDVMSIVTILVVSEIGQMVVAYRTPECVTSLCGFRT